jgi:hypothetical protein
VGLCENGADLSRELINSRRRPRKKAPLSFWLIDGAHNWPTAFVGFCYINCYINFMLCQGGYLMIDDVQLHSAEELARLLVEEHWTSEITNIRQRLRGSS